MSLMSATDDVALIQRCVTGDSQALEEFVERFSRLIYDSTLRTLRLYGISGARDLVADLHNEVFVVLLDRECKALREFEGRNGCRLASYLRTIAVRRTIDFVRARKFLVPLELDESTDGVMPRTAFLSSVDTGAQERAHAAWVTEELLATLREEDRQFCLLLTNESLAPADIARQLRISLSAFYVRKHRILKKLRQTALAQRIVR